MTPTPNLSVFSGTLASGLWTATPMASMTSARRQRAKTGGPQKAAAGADGDDDEYDFEPFEQDPLECGQAGDPIERLVLPAGDRRQLGGLRRENRILVVQRDDARRSKNGLTQPSHPEQQQQNADDELQEVERHAARGAGRARRSTRRARQAPRPCQMPPAASRAMFATARTMVKASTISTSEARKAAPTAGAATLQAT